jgi:hypothetical protein
MYLLYADESGDLRDPAIDYFVVGGIGVHEDAIRPFAAAINNRINNYTGVRLGKQLRSERQRLGLGQRNRPLARRLRPEPLHPHDQRSGLPMSRLHPSSRGVTTASRFANLS